MITNEDIVYVTSDWFTENKVSTHHIAEELAKHNRVLYIEAAGMRAPKASGRDLRKILRKVRQALAPPREVERNIFVYSPLILPFIRHGSVRRINRALLGWFTRRVLARLDFRDPLLWMYVPHFAPLLDAVANKGVVYYITDEYTATPNVDPNAIAALERQVLARADVVFAVSQRLVDEKSKYNPHVYLSRHGVDAEHFRRALDPGTPVPADIASLPRPIAGFFGLVTDYIDLDLLEHTARALPDVSFVLIGHAAVPVTRVAALANVHFIGRRDYADLPGYLKAFDVCLLLYRLGAFSHHANPKKLREYIAGGKPVVSVRIGEVEEFERFVYIADDYDEYVTLIRRAIGEDNDARRALRVDAMSGQSWGARVAWIGDTVARHLPVTRV
jgi:glycosyltransferase involved in cell wall biosynthesis